MRSAEPGCIDGDVFRNPVKLCESTRVGMAKSSCRGRPDGAFQVAAGRDRAFGAGYEPARSAPPTRRRRT